MQERFHLNNLINTGQSQWFNGPSCLKIDIKKKIKWFKSPEVHTSTMEIKMEGDNWIFLFQHNSQYTLHDIDLTTSLCLVFLVSNSVSAV